MFGPQTERAVWAFKAFVMKVPLDQITSEVTNETWQSIQDPVVLMPRRTLGLHTTHVEIYLPEQVMAVIADFEAYPTWAEQVKSVEILDSDADGRAERVKFQMDAGPINRQRFGT